jgi:Putative transposase, YhgA-like
VNKARIREIVRNFPQNGMKLLLENPANVRDVLNLVAPQFVDLIDFDRMKAEPADFIARDFRHLEADVVLRAPIRQTRGHRGKREVLIYILIEHQSEPDRLMPLRLLDYLTQIYKSQGREWAREHKSFNGFRLQPVLPIVLYTGERAWPSVGSLLDLTDLGEQFASVTPSFTPLFFNLPTLPDDSLQAGGGAFGAVLRLFRDRSAARETFQQRLVEVIRELELLPKVARLRWLELLSYIHALVYHVREDSEQLALIASVEATVANDEERRKYMAAQKRSGLTGFEAAGLEHLKRSLLRSLALRFGIVPAEVSDRVGRANKLTTVNRWLERFATAKTLDDVGILPRASARP